LVDEEFAGGVPEAIEQFILETNGNIDPVRPARIAPDDRGAGGA
jgi:hypothetical protein